MLFRKSVLLGALFCALFLVGCGKDTTSNAPPADTAQQKGGKNAKGAEMKRDRPTPPPPPPPPSGN